jgi:brefeldin A-resistance guanine nucleotide exchange factor 1
LSSIRLTTITGKLVVDNGSLFDHYIFKVVWKQVISALGFAFTFYDDDYVVQRAISGLQQCASLANRFNIPEAFDHIVSSVSPTTGLVDIVTPQTFSYPTAEAEGQTLSISPLSVRFGGNLKGQLASVVLFRIVNGNAGALRDGWKQVCVPRIQYITNSESRSDDRNIFKPVSSFLIAQFAHAQGRVPWWC